MADETPSSRPSLEATHLVLGMGNTSITGALYSGDERIEHFVSEAKGNWPDAFDTCLREHGSIREVLVGSVNSRTNKKLTELLHRHEVRYAFVGELPLSIELAAENVDVVGADRIADAYGALALFDGNCITVNLGTTVAVSAVSKDRHWLGGVIYPGMEMSARALAQQTDMLPFIRVSKPLSYCSVTTESNIGGGIYYGLLGALNYLISGLKRECFPGEAVTVVATGGVTRRGVSPDSPSLTESLCADLSEVVDLIEPNLTLIGLQSIYKEWKVPPTD